MSENKYIIPSTGAESARLIDQDHIFTDALGGLFPVEFALDIHKVRSLLNLACGPGEWDCNVAFEYPDLQVRGVDIDPDMVKYAQTLAHLRFLENLTFEVMDIKQPLGFADNTFDIVNGRLLFAFMDRVTWPKLLAECYRVVKPGGAICLAEYEVTITNSTSLQYFYSRLYKRLADQNRTFSVDRRSIGICNMLAHMLRQANFTNVASKPFLIDASSGSPMHYAGTKDTETSLLLLKPYLSQEIQDIEQEALFAQAQLDMRQEGFTSISYGLQVWGEKPV